MDIDFDAVRQLVREALAAMQEMADEPYRGAKGIFPRVWCEWASVAIAELLEVRGYGTWDFVTAGETDGLSGHAWLELRDQAGALVFTVDATLHQFNGWDEPYVGVGVTPAVQQFPVLRYSGPWRSWPVLKSNPSFAQYADKFLAFVSTR